MRAVALLAAVQFTVVVDEAAVPLLGPVIAADLGLGEVSRHVLVTPFALAFIVTLPLAGIVLRSIRPQRLLSPSLFLFAASAASLSLAHSLPWLVASRAVQGAAAAVVATSVLASLHAATRYDRRRGAAFGMFSLVSGSGAVVSLVVLGPLAGLSWRWCPLAIGVLAGGLCIAWIRRARDDGSGPGEGAPRNQTDPEAREDAVVDAVGDETAEAPFSATTSFCAVVAANTALSAATVTMSFALQQTFSWSPGGAGFAFLPLNAAVALAIVLAVRTRFALAAGTRLVTGLCLLAVGCGAVALGSAAPSGVWVATAGIVVGLGLGLVLPLANDGALAGSEEGAMRRAMWLGLAQQAGLGVGALAAAAHAPAALLAVPAAAGTLTIAVFFSARRPGAQRTKGPAERHTSGRKGTIR